MKASISARLPSGIDVTLEVAAENVEGLKVGVDTLVRTFALEAGSGGDPKAPTCECGGSMELREGKNRAGKHYKGWFCTKPDTQCPPIWTN